MLKIRRPLGRLIFNMGIATLGKTVFLIETAPFVLFVAIACTYVDKTQRQEMSAANDLITYIWDINV